MQIVQIISGVYERRYLRNHQAAMDRQVWDGIVGVRGQVRFAGGHWFVPYYADVGAGTSNWTWQALLGLGYRFDWGAVTLAWRALGYAGQSHQVLLIFALTDISRKSDI